MPDALKEQSAGSAGQALQPPPGAQPQAARRAAGHDGAHALLRRGASAAGGEDQPPEHFSHLFGRPEYSHPANDGQKARVLLSVQRKYGNHYAQRVLAKSRSSQGGAEPAAPARTTPGPMIQRAPDDGAAGAAAPPAAAPAATAASGLVIDDSATDLTAGQMRKGEFLTQLRDSVCRAVEDELSNAGVVQAGCPYIDYWFNYYRAQDAQHLERAIQGYAPAAARATSATDYIGAVTERARLAARTSAATGGASSLLGGMGAAAGAAAGAVSSLASGVAGIVSGIGSLLFKGREGGPNETDDPVAVQAQLGPGHSLDNNTQSGMQTAFGQDFSHVRVHTDAKAADLSGRLNARAFTVGRDVAFGAGEYQPGTLIGDALIAHELAHVVQQGGAAAGAPMQKGGGAESSLEEDADSAAVQAVVSVWGARKGVLAGATRSVMPSLKSGLRLSSCKGGRTPDTGLRDTLRQMLQIVGPVDHAAVLAAIQAASRAERQAVLTDASTMALIRSRFSGAAAITVMSSLLLEAHTWQNPMSNDFVNYFVVNNGSGMLPASATMNCWESIMYAAYLAGSINAAWIRNFYADALSTGDPNGRVWALLGFTTALPQYPATVPAAGQLIFYKDPPDAVPGHVLLSLGGDYGISLWNQPNNRDFVQRIRLTDLAGTIYVGNPPW